MAENDDRVPDRLLENDDRCRSHSDGHERVQSHRQRQTQRLTEELRALPLRVTREIRNIECDRSPVRDDTGQRRYEEGEEFGSRMEFRWYGEHPVEASCH